MIEYFTPNRLIVPIDNFSKEDSPKLRGVIDRLVKREKQGVSPFKIELPVSWLGLDLCLKQQPSSVVFYSKCVMFAEGLGIVKEQELLSCLQFLIITRALIGIMRELQSLLIRSLPSPTLSSGL